MSLPRPKAGYQSPCLVTDVKAAGRGEPGGTRQRSELCSCFCSDYGKKMTGLSPDHFPLHEHITFSPGLHSLWPRVFASVLDPPVGRRAHIPLSPSHRMSTAETFPSVDLELTCGLVVVVAVSPFQAENVPQKELIQRTQ